MSGEVIKSSLGQADVKLPGGLPDGRSLTAVTKASREKSSHGL